MRKDDAEGHKVVTSTCTICQIGCGIIIDIKDGKVVSVRGDKSNPLNKGNLCPKGLSSKEYLYNKERLTSPLRRVGERGEGKWEEISWDEAFEITASKLEGFKESFGPESTAFVRGSVKGINFYLIQRFANVFGSPNLAAQSHICFAPRMNASNLTYGFYTVPDFENGTGCIIVWGKNMKGTLFPAYQKVVRAVKDGAKLIVIDPRSNELTGKSDIWCRIKPGTDLALALGLINVIISENLYDSEFVREYTKGFEELRAHVRDYTPEKVSSVTGIPSGLISEIARIYTENSPGIIQWGNAIEQGVNSFQTARALCILRAISGNLCIPGGESQWIMPGRLDFDSLLLTDKLSPEIREKKIDNGLDFIAPTKYEITPESLVNAVLTGKPYPIKAAYVAGANPVVTFTNTMKTIEAFKSLEFLVVADMFMTPTAALADIVFPVTTSFESNGLMSPPYSYPIVSAYHKVVSAGNCKSDFEIFSELAKRLGFGEEFGRNEYKVLDDLVKPFGLTFRELTMHGPITGARQYRSYRENGFATPSGKVELYSNELEGNGFEPLPVYRNFETSNTEYPLTLFSWKDEYYRHSEGRQVPMLRNKRKEPVVLIHPEVAVEKNIKEGDWVYIETEHGRIKQKARYDSDIDKMTLGVDFGWWFPENGYEDLFGSYLSNINVLTSDLPPYNREMGSTALRAIPCRVYNSEDQSKGG